jgi:hypothetical protein
MSSEQKPAEPWHCLINFDSCAPPINDVWSDYSQNKQSAVNLVGDSNLPPYTDPWDVLPCFRQEFEFEDVPLDNTQFALSLSERNENRSDAYQFSHSESGLESVIIPPAYDLMLGDSNLYDTEFLLSQCGDGQALPNEVTEQPSSHQRPKDQHITEPLKRNTEAMGPVHVSASCPSRDLEEEFGAQYTWEIALDPDYLEGCHISSTEPEAPRSADPY